MEDQALDAAQEDRTAGKTTLVIAQTSNEQLDALNARAQAVRRQHHELGEEGLEVPGRPYSLYAGDQVQIRHTIRHPEHGQLRNGTSATITNIDPRALELELELVDGTRLQLTEQQLADADLRLAYVQHPFPAQGHRSDTAHVIIAGHATREGTYVALTRARDRTDIYAAETPDRPADVDRLQDLAERISHTEPQVPSIRTPLAHETTIHTSIEMARTDPVRGGREPEIETEQAGELAAHAIQPAGERGAATQPTGSHSRDEQRDRHGVDREHRDHVPGLERDFALARQAGSEPIKTEPERVWPGRTRGDAERELERDRSPGWEL